MTYVSHLPFFFFSKKKFHGFCSQSILHGGIEPKPYLTGWQLRVPAGTGRIRFHALIKEGGPNLGEFWYPNELTLNEGAPSTAGIRVLLAEPNKSCDDACAAQNMLCVPEVRSLCVPLAHALPQEWSKQQELTSATKQTQTLSSSACRNPLFLRCSDGAAGALQDDDRVCTFANSAQCTSKALPAPPAPTCGATVADKQRLCPCKQDPSKPVLKQTTAAPPPTTGAPPTPASVPMHGVEECTDPPVLGCACKNDADCGRNRCYAGLCIPNGCLYGEVRHRERGGAFRSQQIFCPGWLPVLA